MRMHWFKMGVPITESLGLLEMVTEEKVERFARTPTEEEWAGFEALVDRINEVKRRIDHVRNRLAHGLNVTDEERSAYLDDRIELQDLLVEAEQFMVKFG